MCVVATNFLLSASTGVVPGRDILMEEGAPTSYVLTTLEHIFTFTKARNTFSPNTDTTGLAKQYQSITTNETETSLSQDHLSIKTTSL